MKTSPYVLATAGIAIVGWAYGKLREGFVDMYYNLNAQMNDKGFWANLEGYEYDGTRW